MLKFRCSKGKSWTVTDTTIALPTGIHTKWHKQSKLNDLSKLTPHRNQRHRHTSIIKKKQLWKNLSKTLRPDSGLIAAALISARIPGKSIGRVFHNRLLKYRVPPKNTHKKHIMASLTPTIDVSVPTRSTRTYKRKKSR